MHLDQVVLQFIALPLKSPFETSFGLERDKRAWLVTVRGEGVEGYAESVASDAPLYSEETSASVYYCIRDHIVPRLGGDIGRPEEIWERLAPLRGNRMAKASVEMAIWDWFARARRVPLHRLLGGREEARRIPVGVSIGIQPSAQDLVRVAADYWSQGYRRLKIKIRPGWDVEPLRAVREALGPDVPMMADANSAYTLDDLAALQAFDPLRLMMIEQPLGYDDYIDHAVLARSIETPICLDESVHSPADARKAMDLGACQVINLKVGRVGGYTASLGIHQLALARQIPLWCGGMLETGIGRAHNLHLTTLAGFTLPGDTSASDRYFAEDIIDHPFALNPDGTLTVPAGDGIGVKVDPKRLRAVSAYEEVLPVDRQDNGSRSSSKGGFPDHDLG